MARTVWDAVHAGGRSLSDYAPRVGHPAGGGSDKAKEMDTRWKSVRGENTTLRQVLDARRSTRSSARYRREVLARFIAGAAFVVQSRTAPPPDDLASVRGRWRAGGSRRRRIWSRLDSVTTWTRACRWRGSGRALIPRQI